MALLELSIWGHHRRGLLVDLCKSITAGAEISYQNVATGPLIDHISPRPRNWAHTAAAQAAHTHTHTDQWQHKPGWIKNPDSDPKVSRYRAAADTISAHLSHKLKKFPADRIEPLHLF